MTILMQSNLISLFQEISQPGTIPKPQTNNNLDQLAFMQADDDMVGLLRAQQRIMQTQQDVEKFFQSFNQKRAEKGDDIIPLGAPEWLKEREMYIYESRGFLEEMKMIEELENIFKAAQDLSLKLLPQNSPNFIKFINLASTESANTFTTKEIYKRAIRTASRIMKDLDFETEEIAFARKMGAKLCMQAAQRLNYEYESMDKEKQNLHWDEKLKATNEVHNLPISQKGKVYKYRGFEWSLGERLKDDDLLKQSLPYSSLLSLVEHKKEALVHAFVFDMKVLEVRESREIQDLRDDMAERFGDDWEEQYYENRRKLQIPYLR